MISGVISDPDTEQHAAPSATAEPTASRPRPPTSGAARAEAQRLAQAFADQRGALLAQESRAARDARAATRRARAARRKARAARRRAAARRPSQRGPLRTPGPHGDAAPTPAPVAPPSGGAAAAAEAVEEAAAVDASSASAEPRAACARLDDLPGRDLPPA